jgi:hypothetical protein
LGGFQRFVELFHFPLDLAAPADIGQDEDKTLYLVIIDDGATRTSSQNSLKSFLETVS